MRGGLHGWFGAVRHLPLAAMLVVGWSGIVAAQQLSEITLPAGSSNPNGITAGPDGALWFTEDGAFDNSGNPLGPSKIGRITLDGVITEFATLTVNSNPAGIAVGPDGNLWFTERAANKIGRITVTGTIVEFSVPTANSVPLGIAAGPDGNLWFTEQAGNRIGVITLAGATTEYPVPTANGKPTGINAGPDGNLWFTELAGKIGRITTGGAITEFAGVPGLSSSLFENSIVAGPDGNLWFATGCNQLGRVTTAGAITLFPAVDANCPLMAGSHARSIAVGPDGSLWLAVGEPFGFGSFVAGFTAAGASNGIAQVNLSTFANVVVAGPDGALWFTDGNDKVDAAGTGLPNIGKIGRYGPLPSINSLASAVLPLSRSVQVGDSATAFATIINTNANPAFGCTILPAVPVPGSFFFQTTDPSTNALTGTPGAPVAIAAGGSQSFAVAFTPNAPFAPVDIGFGFDCASVGGAAALTGINTLLLSASTTPVPDIVAEAVTPSGDGILDLQAVNLASNAFAIATVNLGAGDTITVTADTGGADPAIFPVNSCQTNPSTGQCITGVGLSTTATIASGATPTFAVFVQDNGVVPFLPAVNRVFVRFTDSTGVVRGSTSVAIRTQ